jgi:hypothetical protein
MAALRFSQDDYLLGLTCLRALYFHRQSHPPKPSVAPEAEATTASAPYSLEAELMALARQRYPGGRLVSAPPETEEALAQTEALLRGGREAVFGAAARTKAGDFAVADILKPRSKGLELIAVSPAPGVREHDLRRLAFQYHVFSQKYAIRRALLLTVNPGYLRRAGLEPDKLFKLHKLTAQVRALAAEDSPDRLAAELSRRLAGFQHGAKAPEPGPRCYLHGGCPYREPCWRTVHHIPAYSLFDVLEDKTEAARLYRLHGSADLNQLRDLPLSPRQRDEVDCWQRQGLICRPKELRLFLDRLPAKMLILDYEIIRPPWPLFPGTRPYEPIPAQYFLANVYNGFSNGDSLGATERYWARPDSLQAEADSNPWKSLVGYLAESIYLYDMNGPILVWNKALVEDCLRRAALACPDQARDIQSLNRQLIELGGLFQARALYDHRQFGSDALPAVYAALTGRDYGGLDLPDPLPWYGPLPPQYAAFVGLDSDGRKVNAVVTDNCGRRVLAMQELLTVISQYTT